MGFSSPSELSTANSSPASIRYPILAAWDRIYEFPLQIRWDKLKLWKWFFQKRKERLLSFILHVYLQESVHNSQRTVQLNAASNFTRIGNLILVNL